MTPRPGFTVTDHAFSVPLDHADPSGPAIELFARSLADPARAGEDLPWLLYLEGGPGGKGPRPLRPGGWIGHALKTHRVLLLDQRGTGRSTPITPRTPARFPGAKDLAAYLRRFRADSIVRDCEVVRERLGIGQWETLGQSYGGFLTLTYLSTAPSSLRACYVTGGLPGLGASAYDVYTRTHPRVRAKNAEFYARYPGDLRRVREIADHLSERDVRLPDGDRLTVGRLRMLGLEFGMGDGFERVHWRLDEAWDGSELSETFLCQVMAVTSLAERPIFAVLQEACYGQDATPTGWAAERALASFPEFAENACPLLFTGEMFYPWMFRELRALRPFAEAADLLAAAEDWQPLYDPVRLAANDVPVAAVVYHDDMYVDAELSLRTAGQVGNLRTWVTDEWEHDGVMASGDQVLSRLMNLAAGRV